MMIDFNGAEGNIYCIYGKARQILIFHEETEALLELEDRFNSAEIDSYEKALDLIEEYVLISNR